MEYFNDLSYTFFSHNCENTTYGDGFPAFCGIQFIASGRIALIIDVIQVIFVLLNCNFAFLSNRFR